MCNLLFSLISYRLQANGIWFLHKDFHSFCEFCWLEAPDPDKDHFISKFRATPPKTHGQPPKSRAYPSRKIRATMAQILPVNDSNFATPRCHGFCRAMSRILPVQVLKF